MRSPESVPSCSQAAPAPSPSGPERPAAARAGSPKSGPRAPGPCARPRPRAVPCPALVLVARARPPALSNRCGRLFLLTSPAPRLFGDGRPANCGAAEQGVRSCPVFAVAAQGVRCCPVFAVAARGVRCCPVFAVAARGVRCCPGVRFTEHGAGHGYHNPGLGQVRACVARPGRPAAEEWAWPGPGA
jgi:hypothetical protein